MKSIKKAVKNAVILYSDSDSEICGRIEKALALMIRQGIIRTQSRLNIAPGENVVDMMATQENSADVVIAVLSVDLDIDTLFRLIAEHENHQKCLLVIYARNVDEAILEELEKKKIPVIPRQPINSHPNQDVAYQKIVRSIRKHFSEKSNPNSLKKRRKQDILLMLARRNIGND